MSRSPHRPVILDMDSSESPVHGEQEGASYNGHFGSICYHPLFVFNQFGDCEGAMLRAGNVHSAHRWRDVLVLILPPPLRQVSRYLDVEELIQVVEAYGHADQRILKVHIPQHELPEPRCPEEQDAVVGSGG